MEQHWNVFLRKIKIRGKHSMSQKGALSGPILVDRCFQPRSCASPLGTVRKCIPLLQRVHQLEGRLLKQLYVSRDNT